MERKFSKRGWKFPVKVDPSTGRIMTSEYEDDIKEALSIILRTTKGERVMRPEFGSNVSSYVFEDMNVTNTNLMQKEVEDAILMWEPRVKDVVVNIEKDAEIDNKLIIEVSYVVKKTDNLFNLVYPFYTNEGTKIE